MQRRKRKQTVCCSMDEVTQQSSFLFLTCGSLKHFSSEFHIPEGFSLKHLNICILFHLFFPYSILNLLKHLSSQLFFFSWIFLHTIYLHRHIYPFTSFGSSQQMNRYIFCLCCGGPIIALTSLTGTQFNQNKNMKNQFCN